MEIRLKEDERIDDLERNGYRIIQNKKRFCFGMDAVLLSGFVCEGENNRGGKGIGCGMTDNGGKGIGCEMTGNGRKSAGCEMTGNSGTAADCGDGGVVEKSEASGLAGGTFISRKPIVMADLGTGTGIIPILLRAKLGATGFGLEIQPEVRDMAERSVLLNDLQDDLQIVEGDIKEAALLLGKGKFDIVTSNPPYMKNAGGLTNPNESKAISRHEILCSFEDVAREARALLKSGGRFYLVHRPQRLAEIITVLKENKLEPKRLRVVHSFAESEATMVLVEAVSGGGEFMKVEKPLIIYKEKGVYTDEILEIYGF